MRRWGADEGIIRAAVGAYADRRCERSAKDTITEEELDGIVKSAMGFAPEHSSLAEAASLEPASWADMEAGSIEFAWDDWLPYGIVTMIVGSPSAGKSFLALQIANCFINGDPWPDGTPFTGETGKVVWCETEAAQRINLDRANAWGLPLDKVLTLGPDPMEDVFLDDPEHRARLAAMAEREEVKLIVIDSLSGAHSRDENSSDMKEIGKWLAQVARDTGIPIIITHHLRKKTALDVGEFITIDMVRGSGAIVNSIRAVWGIDSPVPMHTELKRFYPIRVSMGRLTDPLGMEIGEGGMVTFGDAPGYAKPVPVIEQACELLKEVLAEGPMLVKDLKELFEAEDISMTTAHRARKKLGVFVKKEGSRWIWNLPSKGG